MNESQINPPAASSHGHMVNGKLHLVDNQGRMVPENKIRPALLLEDQTVMFIIAKAKELNARILQFRQEANSDIDELLLTLHEKYNLQKGGKKGNIKLEIFDGLYKVQISVQEFIYFGPELESAGELVKQCVESWASDANDNLRAVVTRAFQTDRHNRVNKEALLSLRKLEIDDERWKLAMAALTDSIRISSSKEYLRMYQRDSTDDKFQAITIDLADSVTAQICQPDNDPDNDNNNVLALFPQGYRPR